MHLKSARAMLAMIVLLLVSGTGSVDAKTYYLDNAPGIVNGSTTYNPASRSNTGGSALVYTSPSSAGGALANGDVLYVRGGEYYAVSGGGWTSGSININASNCLIKNYNNEVAWIKGGASRTTPQNHANNAVNFSGSNNVIDGLYFYGGFIFSGTNNTLKNSDLSGGWDHQGPWMSPDAGWPNCIRFMNSKNALVQNCKIHDNIMQNGNDANMAIIMHERDDNTIIENCEFFNTAAYFGYLKYQSGYNGAQFSGSGTHTTYRYNVFRGPNGGFELVAGTPDPPNPVQRQLFYQNIWINSGAGFHDSFVENGVMFAWIYNNVFYRPKIGALWNWQSRQVYNFFNNIVYWDQGGSGRYNQYWESNPPNPWGYNYIDYNNYYTPNGNQGTWLHGGFSTTTLSSWVSHTGNNLDTHSITSSPNFLNGSGQFNVSADFRRNSYPGNGRGGSYSSIMGAYITGSEIIGISTGSSPPPPPPGIPMNPQATAGDRTVTVQWVYVAGASSYNLYWSTSPGVTKSTGNKISNVVSPYVHGGLQNGTTYYYIVAAVGQGGEGNASAEVSASPAALPVKQPIPPSALIVF